MTEELKQKAQEALVTMIDDALKVRDFAIDQAPDVVQQLLTYTLVYHLVFFLLGWVLLLGFPCWVVWCFKNFNDIDDKMGYGFIPGVLLVPSGCGFIAVNLVWIKIWLAPKICLQPSL